MDEEYKGKERERGATLMIRFLFAQLGCQPGLDSGRHVLFLSTAHRRLQKVFVES